MYDTKYQFSMNYVDSMQPVVLVHSKINDTTNKNKPKRRSLY